MRILNFLVTTFWTLLIVMVLVVAAYACLGRLFAPLIMEFHDVLEVRLEKVLKADIQLGELKGTWVNFRPGLELESLRINGSGNKPAITVDRAVAELDVIGSLKQRTWVFSDIYLRDVALTIAETPSGKWQLKGFPSRKKKTNWQRVVERLLAQHDVELRRINIVLENQKGLSRQLLIDRLELDTSGKHHHLEAMIQPLHGVYTPPIRVAIDAIGRRFDHVKLQGYLFAPSLNWVGWLQEALAPTSYTLNELEGEAEVWFSYSGDALFDLSSKLNLSKLAVGKANEAPQPMLSHASQAVSIQPTPIDARASNPLIALNNVQLTAFAKIRGKEQLNLQLSDVSFSYKNHDIPAFAADVNFHRSAVKPKKHQATIVSAHMPRPTSLHLLGETPSQPEKQEDNSLSPHYHVDDSSSFLVAKLNQIPIAPLAAIIHDSGLLKPKYQARLQALNPRGSAKNLSFKYFSPTDTTEKSDFRIDLDLSDASVDSWGGVPHIADINAKLSANKTQGIVSWSDQNIGLSFPKIFRNKWDVSESSGKVAWHWTKQAITISGYGVDGHTEAGQVHGDFHVALDPVTQNNQLGLALGVRGSKLANKAAFLPASLIDSELLKWLDSSIVAGDLREGVILYNGSLDNKKSNQQPKGESQQQSINGAVKSRGTLMLYLEAENSELAYQDDWPNVRGMSTQILLREGDLYAHVERGKIFDVELSSCDVKVPQGRFVNITGKARGDASAVLQLLTDTPLKEQMGDLVNTWTAKGKVDSALDIHVPLSSSGKHIRADVKSRLKGVDLSLNDHNLPLKKLQGSVHYSTETGVAVPKIKGHLWNKPFLASIKHESIGKPSERVEIDTQLDIDAKDLAKWTDIRAIQRLEGEIPADIDLKFYLNDERPQQLQSSVTVKSNLKSTVVNLPQPLKKPFGKTTSAHFYMTLEGDEQISKLSYGRQLSSVLKLRSSEIVQGHVSLGKRKAVLPNRSGVYVTGDVPVIDYDDWALLIEDLQALYAQPSATGVSNDQGQSIEDVVRQIRVDTDRLLAFELEMGSSEIKVDRLASAWNIQAAGGDDKIRGTIVLPDSDSLPLSVNLKRLVLPDTSQEQAKNKAHYSPQFDDPLVDVDPRSIPAIDASIQQFFIGSDDFGTWSFEFRPQADGAKINNLDADVKLTKIQGDLVWLYSPEKGHQTYSQIAIDIDDLQPSLTAWGLDPSLNSQHAHFDVDLSWAASPAFIDLPYMDGRVDLRIVDGLLIEGPSAGALKLFGAFNVDNISRRLKLDFSDIYQKGLTYDVITGGVLLSLGDIYIPEAINFRGPSGKFSFTGKTNYVTELLDLEMAVTLPITSSLPIIAVLSGLAPPIAGAIFVTEKLIGNELERFTSASYKIKGSWDEPGLTINKRFTKDLAGKEAQQQSLKSRLLSIFGVDDELSQADLDTDELIKPLYEDYDAYDY